MPVNDLRRFLLSRLPADPSEKGDWIWHGYLPPGAVTLLTSQWKTGKTTLLAGLLRTLGQGGDFIGRPARAGRAWIVSEESLAQWAARIRKIPIGGHAELLARPFLGRPTVEEWNVLTDAAVAARRRGELDLFVVDPLAAFLPRRCESDAATLPDMLQSLRRLAAEGVSILLLHHQRRRPLEWGLAARGSGALVGLVDIVLELSRFSALRSDRCRRTLIARSRMPETPARLAFEWDPETGVFTGLGDPTLARFEDNWAQVLAILKSRKAAATHTELLMAWPPDQQRPSPSTLYDWLNRAAAENRVRREGGGNRADPYRYRLDNEGDEPRTAANYRR